MWKNYRTDVLMLVKIKVGWLVGFYTISTFVGYLTPNPFYANNQLYFKKFSLAYACCSDISTVLLSKTCLFQAIQFSQAVQIQQIQFSIIQILFSQLDVKTVLC